MNKILIIDPGKSWGQFVSKMYCYQKLSEHLNSKIIFLKKNLLKPNIILNPLLFVNKSCILRSLKKELKIFSKILNRF